MLAILFDPTLTYLLLLLGLWIGATSFVIPGTGIAEFSAIALLGVSFWVLGQSSTRWVSVLALIIGVALFILIPLVTPRHTRWAEFALIPQVLGAVFLFEKGHPSYIVIATMVVLSWMWNRFALVPLMDRMRTAPAAGNEIAMLVGAHGRVTTSVNPPHPGTAYINGETWTIRSHEPLEVDDSIRVSEVRGLEAIVTKFKVKPTSNDEIAS